MRQTGGRESTPDVLVDRAIADVRHPAPVARPESSVAAMMHQLRACRRGIETLSWSPVAGPRCRGATSWPCLRDSARYVRSECGRHGRTPRAGNGVYDWPD